MSNWINNIARLIKKKAKPDGSPGGYFLVFERRQDKNQKYIGENPFPLTINEGDKFQARVKKEELQKLVDNGEMSQETANKISENVKFEFSIAPKEEQTKTPPKASAVKKPAKKSDDDGEVDF